MPDEKKGFLKPKSVGIGIALLLIGAIAGVLVSGTNAGATPTENKLITEYYAAEVAAGMSPSEYVQALHAGVSIATLVDLRTKEAYAAGHLAGAISLPVDQMTNTQIIQAFSQLPNDKPVVTYCYSSYCMLSRKLGNFLAENGLFVKHLTAGGLEINRDYSGDIVKGVEPGTVEITNPNTGCPPNSVSGWGGC